MTLPCCILEQCAEYGRHAGVPAGLSLRRHRGGSARDNEDLQQRCLQQAHAVCAEGGQPHLPQNAVLRGADNGDIPGCPEGKKDEEGGGPAEVLPRQLLAPLG